MKYIILNDYEPFDKRGSAGLHDPLFQEFYITIKTSPMSHNVGLMIKPIKNKQY